MESRSRIVRYKAARTIKLTNVKHYAIISDQKLEIKALEFEIRAHSTLKKALLKTNLYFDENELMNEMKMNLPGCFFSHAQHWSAFEVPSYP